MKIYGFGGLGGYNGIFTGIKLSHKLIPVSYLPPLENEPIADYTARLIAPLDLSGPYAFLGISFGGIVATEAAKITDPRFIVLISSVRTNRDIPFYYKAILKSGLINRLSGENSQLPSKITEMFLGSRHSNVIGFVMDKMNEKFTRWAVTELIAWDNTERLPNTLLITGSEDRILPPSTSEPEQVVINGGSHFMAYDRGKDISMTIDKYIKGLNISA